VATPQPCQHLLQSVLHRPRASRREPRVQRLDHIGTVSPRPRMGTLPAMPEERPNRLGVPDLLVEAEDLGVRGLAQAPAGAVQHLGDTGEVDAEALPELDERDAPQLLLTVVPPAPDPAGRRYQAEVVVVAQCRGRDAGTARRLSDGHESIQSHAFPWPSGPRLGLVGRVSDGPRVSTRPELTR